MIGWALAVIFFVLFVATLLAAYHLTEKLSDAVENEKAAHEACHEQTIDVLSTASRRSDATALEAAADAWDSVRGQAQAERIVREEYVVGGPSVPALWLRDRARGLFRQVEEERA